MWLSKYFLNRRLNRLLVKRAGEQASLVILARTDAYYLTSERAREVAELDEKIAQIMGVLNGK